MIPKMDGRDARGGKPSPAPEPAFVAAGTSPEPSGTRPRLGVILTEIRPEVETPESFAIKFSLLTRAPINRVKFMISRVPAVVWSGEERAQAERVLSLLEEAGGRGRIVGAEAPPPAAATAPEPGEPRDGKPAAAAGEPAPAARARGAKEKAACPWCGFPMKEGETVCGFCLSRDGQAPPAPAPPPIVRRRGPISPKRLLIYGAILVVELALAIATNR